LIFVHLEKQLFFETVKTFNGKRQVRRVKTSVFIWTGILCVALGILLVTKFQILVGATVVITLAPCLFLYPIIRLLFFGGKDSPVAVVTTVVVEEAIKQKISSSGKRRR
jgi:hypothetical protein